MTANDSFDSPQENPSAVMPVLSRNVKFSLEEDQSISKGDHTLLSRPLNALRRSRTEIKGKIRPRNLTLNQLVLRQPQDDQVDQGDHGQGLIKLIKVIKLITARD